jgi:hypothetical protein
MSLHGYRTRTEAGGCLSALRLPCQQLISLAWLMYTVIKVTWMSCESLRRRRPRSMGSCLAVLLSELDQSIHECDGKTMSVTKKAMPARRLRTHLRDVSH